MIRNLFTLLLVAFATLSCKPRYECSAETPCPFGETCVGGFCQEVACATSAQCPVDHFCTVGRQCVPGCEVDGDCAAGFVCDAEEAACVEADCQDTRTDCGYKEYCNAATGECYTAGGDFCKTCTRRADDCAPGNVCWGGYCAVNCDNGRECPSGFDCLPFVDEVGNVVGNYCITYCWQFEGYAPGSFARGPEDAGPLPLECDEDEARELLPPPPEREESSP